MDESSITEEIYEAVRDFPKEEVRRFMSAEMVKVLVSARVSRQISKDEFISGLRKVQRLNSLLS